MECKIEESCRKKQSQEEKEREQLPDFFMGRTAACDVRCQKQRQYKVQNIQPEYVKAQDSAVRIEKDRDKQRPCKESQKRGGQKCVGRVFQEKPG